MIEFPGNREECLRLAYNHMRRNSPALKARRRAQYQSKKKSNKNGSNIPPNTSNSCNTSNTSNTSKGSKKRSKVSKINKNSKKTKKPNANKKTVTFGPICEMRDNPLHAENFGNDRKQELMRQDSDVCTTSNASKCISLISENSSDTAMISSDLTSEMSQDDREAKKWMAKLNQMKLMSAQEAADVADQDSDANNNSSTKSISGPGTWKSNGKDGNEEYIPNVRATPQKLNNSAWQLLGLGRVEKALCVVQSAVKLDCQDKRSQMIKAECLQQLGRYHEASQILMQLHNEAPGSPSIKSLYARVLYSIFEQKQAKHAKHLKQQKMQKMQSNIKNENRSNNCSNCSNLSARDANSAILRRSEVLTEMDPIDSNEANETREPKIEKIEEIEWHETSLQADFETIIILLKEAWEARDIINKSSKKWIFDTKIEVEGSCMAAMKLAQIFRDCQRPRGYNYYALHWFHAAVGKIEYNVESLRVTSCFQYCRTLLETLLFLKQTAIPNLPRKRKKSRTNSKYHSNSSNASKNGSNASKNGSNGKRKDLNEMKEANEKNEVKQGKLEIETTDDDSDSLSAVSARNNSSGSSSSSSSSSSGESCGKHDHEFVKWFDAFEIVMPRSWEHPFELIYDLKHRKRVLKGFDKIKKEFEKMHKKLGALLHKSSLHQTTGLKSNRVDDIESAKIHVLNAYFKKIICDDEVRAAQHFKDAWKCDSSNTDVVENMALINAHYGELDLSD